MTTELEKNDISGIFITEHPISNMTMQRIVVSNPAIVKILELIKLPEAMQQEAVDDLVGRTPDWVSLETEEQIRKIKIVLTMETVAYYLRCIEAIRSQVDILEIGIDHEGSVVIEAYYTNINREQRRAMEASTSDDQKAALKAFVSQFDQITQSGNIIELAKAKMERAKGKKR